MRRTILGKSGAATSLQTIYNGPCEARCEGSGRRGDRRSSRGNVSVPAAARAALLWPGATPGKKPSLSHHTRIPAKYTWHQTNLGSTALLSCRLNHSTYIIHSTHSTFIPIRECIYKDCSKAILLFRHDTCSQKSHLASHIKSVHDCN